MMKLWMETYAKSTSLRPSVALSVVAHVAIIGGAVAATARTAMDRLEPENSFVQFLVPPNRNAGQQSQREMVRYVAIAPEIGDGVAVQAIEKLKRVAQLPGPDERNAQAMPALPSADSVFSLLDVDSAAVRYEWSAAPAYPPKMLEKNTEGFVKAGWVVGQDGYADTASLRIVESTHAEFEKAVRDALPFMRFKAAKVGRMTVNQLVQQEFTFRLTTVAVDSLKPRKPIP